MLELLIAIIIIITNIIPFFSLYIPTPEIDVGVA